MGKKVIITASAGGGHTAVAHYEKERSVDDEVTIIDFYDWIPNFLGKKQALKWEKARQKGCYETSIRLNQFQWIAEILFGPFIFFGVFKALSHCGKGCQEVVTTQPIGLKAILKAVRAHNWWKEEAIWVTLIFTDMPTEKCHHYIDPVRSLKEKDKQTLKIKLPSVWGSDEEMAKDLKELFDFPLSRLERLEVKDFPVLKVHKDPRLTDFIPGKSCTLKIAYNEWEKELADTIPNLEQILQKQREKYAIEVGEKDLCFLLMLGSIPQEKAIFAFSQAFIDLGKHLDASFTSKIFVFVATGKTGCEEQIFKKLADELKTQTIHPNIVIIPIPYLDPFNLASIATRSFVFLRPSGLSSMEAMARDWVCKGKQGELFVLWLGIYDSKTKRQLKRKELDEYTLQKEGVEPVVVPFWEGGNGEVLVKTIRAKKVVLPGIFDAVLEIVQKEKHGKS